MWLLKLKIKHDCTIGTRCEKYGCVAYSMALGNWAEGGCSFSTERHTIEGEPESVRKFIGELKNDGRITNLEAGKNTVFFISKEKERIPSSFYSQKMFFTKPVFVDKKGFEHWEVGSYDRDVLSKFAKALGKQNYGHFEVLQLKNAKLNNIYFPAIAPNLTGRQKRAFELAVENGYYDIPKTIDLKGLSKIMKISLATCQEHLKRAEAKVIPKLRAG